ncbi:MAG: glycosyltransferase family 4 protein [Candidatus Microgenomates bacterium]
MKILFFSPYFYPYTSGLTTYPWKILNYLSKKHDITVLTFNHHKNVIPDLIRNPKNIDSGIRGNDKSRKLKIFYLPYLFKISKGYISPQSFFYFLQEIKKTDILIVNQPSVEGLSLLILAKIFKKKTISLLHCFLSGGKNIFEKIIFKIANFFVYFQLLLSNKIVAYTKDYLKNYFIFNFIKHKTYFHLPPILKENEDKKYLSFLKKLTSKKIAIGYAGRISSEKGLEHLINSLTRYTPALNRTGSGSELYVSRYTLLFAGPYGKNVTGENSYFLKIKNLLDKKKIDYHFLGNLNLKKLFAFYKAIDILVLPSINSTEAFGMVQAEAMISGTPVIATNLPGVNIPITLTKMGKIIEPKNEKQLIKTIFEIINNRKKYTNPTLIKNAQKIFDIKEVYQFWEKIINE